MHKISPKVQIGVRIMQYIMSLIDYHPVFKVLAA